MCMCVFFFFNDTATTEIYTLSLHDALPICMTTARSPDRAALMEALGEVYDPCCADRGISIVDMGVVEDVRLDGSHVSRSEEHTSELQSRQYLVCRLLLEKKKKDTMNNDDIS